TGIVSGSRGSTFRLWNATRAQQFQEHTKIHSSTSFLHRHRAICFKFASPQAWNMHCGTTLLNYYLRPPLMNSIQPRLSCWKMDV
ncbi:hypothetical protein P692DRAFT_20897116, partial [Suillus brevipes Sb2]